MPSFERNDLNPLSEPLCPEAFCLRLVLILHCQQKDYDRPSPVTKSTLRYRLVRAQLYRKLGINVAAAAAIRNTRIGIPALVFHPSSMMHAPIPSFPCGRVLSTCRCFSSCVKHCNLFSLSNQSNSHNIPHP